MKRYVYSLLLSVASLLLIGASAAAAPAKTTTPNRGLAISPIRQFITVDAGNPQTSSLTVTNFTDKAIGVTISVERFDVVNYTYGYRFSAPEPNWIALSQTKLTLQPNDSKNVSFRVVTPKDAEPGGHYYTLIASAPVSSGGVDSTVQTADLLYLTINGKLDTSNQIKASRIQHVAFGQQFTYSLDLIDTGNVHFFAYTYGALHGLWPGPAQAKTAHLLMPGAIRRVSGNIPTPKLPGIYKAVYGYSTDDGATVTRSSYVVFIPPWFVAFALLALLVGYNLYGRRKQKRARAAKSD